MNFLQGAVLSLMACFATSAPNFQREHRSLEDIPYLPPEPYLPPALPPVSLNLIPPDAKDYLPPGGVPLHVGLSARNGQSEASADAIGDMVEVYATVSDVEENSPTPIKTGEPEGYFYPRPLQSFNLPNKPEDMTERSNIDEATDVTPEVEENDRNVRSPQTSLLRTNPEDGPVRISTQPFQLSRAQEERNLKVRRSDKNNTKPSDVRKESQFEGSVKFRRQVDNRRQARPASRGQLTAQTLPARAPPKVFPQ